MGPGRRSRISGGNICCVPVHAGGPTHRFEPLVMRDGTRYLRCQDCGDPGDEDVACHRCPSARRAGYPFAASGLRDLFPERSPGGY